MAIKLGVDVKPVQDYLNRLSRATVTRIRRCINIKSIALEKIREDSPEARAYGFKHLNRVIKLQIKSYPQYSNNIERFLIEVKTIEEKIAPLQSLDDKFFSRILFSSNKHNLEFDIALTEEKFEIIKKKATIIYGLVEAQRRLIKPSISGDEEAELRRLLSIELEKSEELIKELNSCMGIVFRALNAIKVFQIRFIKFLERCRANNFSNIIDDSQEVGYLIRNIYICFYHLV